jgi:hypothetical protein
MNCPVAMRAATVLDGSRSTFAPDCAARSRSGQAGDKSLLPCHWAGMRRARHRGGDRFTAGLLAGLLAYFLILQGLFGAYTQAAMAASDPGGMVICSSLGAVGHGVDGQQKKLAHDCCSMACQAGCAIGPAVPATDLGVAFDLIRVAQVWYPSPAVRAPPFHPGLAQEPRGPPSLSI